MYRFDLQSNVCSIDHRLATDRSANRSVRPVVFGNPRIGLIYVNSAIGKNLTGNRKWRAVGGVVRGHRDGLRARAASPLCFLEIAPERRKSRFAHMVFDALRIAFRHIGVDTERH